MPGPLSNIRVIELGGIGPVPHAGMMLADLGAEVIQVVRPEVHADGATRSDVMNRGKKSVRVDLKRGSEIILRLCESTDILIEGFRPGVAERLGLGPGDCRSRNHRLIYGRMTGWGQDGPLADRAGHDINYIATSGVLAAIGSADGPVPPLNLVGDFGGGSMLLVVGVLAALSQRHGTGRGDVVDAAMVDGSALLMAMHHGAMAGGRWRGERGSDLFDGSAPFYTTYRTADDKWVAVGALEPQFFQALVEKLEVDLSDLGAQMDRSGWAEMRRRFADVFVGKSRAEWDLVFSGVDACVSGVYDMAEAPGHPHLQARSTFTRNGFPQPAPAPRFGAGPAAPGAIPDPGEHTAKVLTGLGFSPDEISTLSREGTIRIEENR